MSNGRWPSATDVCRALSFMHGQGLIHRDLKPANIFLTEDGTAKVGDFGLAVALDRSRITQQGSLVGQPPTCRPNRPSAARSRPSPTSTPSARCSTRWSRAARPSRATTPRRSSASTSTPRRRPELAHGALSARALRRSSFDAPEGPEPSGPESADAVLARTLGRRRPGTVEAHATPTPTPIPRRPRRGVFVGRESQLEKLPLAFDEAFAGRGSVVMLVGEPGIGKTRTTQGAGDVRPHARRPSSGAARTRRPARPLLALGTGRQMPLGRFVPTGGDPAELDQRRGRLNPASSLNYAASPLR